MYGEYEQADCRQALARASTALDGCGEACVVLTPEGQVKLLNQQAAEDLNCNKAKAIDTPVQTVVPRSIRVALERSVHEAWRQQGPVEVEHHVRPLDRWYQIRIRPAGGELLIFWCQTTRAHRQGKRIWRGKLS
jgi:PAS domain-containing protein